MSDSKPDKKWYTKKRYIIPLGLVVVLTIIGLNSSSGSQTTSNLKSQNNIVAPKLDGNNNTLDVPNLAPDQNKELPKVEAAPQVTPNAPNGTYKNVDGNIVPSPYSTPDNSIPAGASARCRDGTYSFSQHRSGTCSHHGGVAQWL